MSSRPAPLLTAAGLFAGIGGVELGFERAGISSSLLCEIDPSAVAVLRERFPGVRTTLDVRELEALPAVDVVAAGYPCQDLSQAGRTAGINGRNSGLVGEVLRLVAPSDAPRWVVLENVPFMLSLAQGEAMRFVTTSLENLGYAWAYRVVDTRAFGLPQRRQRVVLVASRHADPRDVLFVDDAGARQFVPQEDTAFGFYWTEGTRGLGWAIDAVPTLKGGSTIGIPSAPAILLPDGRVVTPDVRDAERLQGFDAGWTEPARARPGRRGGGHRWKLIGNAVSVPVSEWLARRLINPGSYARTLDGDEIAPRSRWPLAASGRPGTAPRRVDVSAFPQHAPYQSLAGFLEHQPVPLSERATAGFLGRCRRGSLRFPAGFLDAVEAHLDRIAVPRLSGVA